MISKIYVHLRNAYFERDKKNALDKIWKEQSGRVNLKQLSNDQIKSIQSYWEPLVGKKVNVKWHQLIYSITGVFKPEYEPFEVCMHVQDMFSPRLEQRLFDDKGLYTSLLSGFNFPIRVAECVNGVLYLPELYGTKEVNSSTYLASLLNLSDCIIKPSKYSDGGNGVSSIVVNDGIETSTHKDIKTYLEEFVKKYGINYCIERKIHECDNLKSLNPSSCNSLRVHTYRDRTRQEIVFVSSYVRIGKKGNIVDNAASGGLCAQVYKDGYLKEAITVYPYKRYKETEVGINLNDYKIDNFDRIVSTALAAHSKLPMFDLIGWDMVVDEQGRVVIIEFNPNPDVRIEQCVFNNTCMGDHQVDIVKQAYK